MFIQNCIVLLYNFIIYNCIIILGWTIAYYGIAIGTCDRRTGSSLLGKDTNYSQE